MKKKISGYCLIILTSIGSVCADTTPRAYAAIPKNQQLASNPFDDKARLRLANIYLEQKNYQQAKTEFELVLTQTPNFKAARLGLIEAELAAGHYSSALLLVQQALTLYPNDPDFLAQRASLYFYKHMYARAADLNKKILAKYPQNKVVKEQLKEIQQINPHVLYGLNEIGASSEVDYVSDLKSVWQYSNLYYSRDTSWGLASLSLNNASRFGINANQGAVNLFPIMNKYLYFRLVAAYANQPRLFPTYVGGVESYFSSAPVELSAGAVYSSILPQINFTQYTGSISKEWGDYWISFRPNYYDPAQGKSSLLFTGTLIRYFSTKDTYAKITLGTGTSPDLANFETVNFIVIKNNFVNINFQFPIINHSFLLNIGGDYQHWVFPSSKVREISGGNIGFNYRFGSK